MSTSTLLDSVLLRPIAFTKPIRTAAPLSWIPHVPFAYWLTDVLRPATLVELGTHSGTSYSALAHAVSLTSGQAACYAVDTWQGDEQAGFYGEDVFTEWKSFHDARFGRFSSLVRATFDEARTAFADGTIDLLHIDGLHTYDAVRHDFESWLPRMSARGVVIMHDVNERQEGFGVWRLWEDIRRAYPTFTFLHGHGLGVVAVGTRLAPEIEWLVAAGDESERTATIRRFFSTLGAGVALDAERAAADASHAEAIVTLDSMRRGLTERIQLLEGRAKAIARQQEEALAAAMRLADEQEQRARTHARELKAVRANTARLECALSAAGARERRLDEALSTAAIRERQLDDALLDAQFESTRLAGELDAARGAADSIRREVAAITASRTWRWTAPFRRVSRTAIARTATSLRHLGPRGVPALGRLAVSPRAIRSLSRLATSPLFDGAFYRQRYPDVGASGQPPAVHYVLSGGREGRAPQLLFDGEYYLTRYSDVRTAGLNALEHFISEARGERRTPHPLFDTEYYLSQNPEVTGGQADALQHFLAVGGRMGRRPHRLFDTAYYLANHTDVAASGVNPLLHFLAMGGREGRQPHPLFDMPFYLSRNPDVSASGENPLLHYVRDGAREGRQPHPLFDAEEYLRQVPGLRDTGLSPLEHFDICGWREGRRPNAFFDPRWYLRTYPDVAASGMNPLTHYVTRGWRERRDPGPDFSTSAYLADHPDIAASREEPLAHYLAHGRREGRSIRQHVRPPAPVPERRVRFSTRGRAAGRRLPARPVLCVTHVVPDPPRAGNEYRIDRMLRMLRSRDYTTVLLCMPLEDVLLDESRMDALASAYGNLVVARRDGTVRFDMREVPDIVSSIDGEWSRPLPVEASRLVAAAPRNTPALEIERQFCPSTLATLASHLQGALGPTAIMAEYIWMSRLLPGLAAPCLRIIDTHDVFSARDETQATLGAAEIIASAADESAMLARADLVLAIQENEAAVLRRLVPDVEVITTGVDFDVDDAGETSDDAPAEPVVLCIGSSNPMNRAGLDDFLRFGWPEVLRQVPSATLVVAGDVAAGVEPGTPRVIVAGRVDDTTSFYKRARVVINPTTTGSGLKIKTVEALSHFKPVVSWPNGLDGLPATIHAALPPAGDWLEFAERVVAHLRRDGEGLSADVRETIARFASPEAAYGPLLRRLDAFFASPR